MSTMNTNTNGIKDDGEKGIAGVAIDGENLQGANDPDNDKTGGPASTVDYNDGGTTDELGRAKVTVSGAQPGAAEVCFYADADLDNVFDAHGAPSDGGDCAEAPGEAESVTDTTDVVSARWGTAGVAYRLTLSPRQATKVKGATHTVTATVTDAFGAPVANQKVDFDITAGSRNDRGGLELDDAPTDARGEA
ncbi:MAG TPA: hypothetical protein VE975_05040, partial [Actinomycetota bacterium]|nr:hypothetical protein [Actinomycetota bacterium]